jgi:hypothetical protein
MVKLSGKFVAKTRWGPLKTKQNGPVFEWHSKPDHLALGHKWTI